MPGLLSAGFLLGVCLLTLVADIEELQSLLVDVSTLGQRDLAQVWRQIEDMDARAASEVLLAATPEIADQYSTVAGVLSAEFYDSRIPDSSFRAVAAAPPPAGQVEGSTRWALSSLYRDTSATPLDLLAGSLQRMVFGTSRRTMLDNANREPGSTWARYASSTACGFCRMLATRGNAYTSKSAAVGADKRSTYHDNCRCMAVCVRAGDSYEPPSYVEKWEAEYTAAAKKSATGKRGGIDFDSLMSEMHKNDK